MKSVSLTDKVRRMLDGDERARYDDVALLLGVYDRCGLHLTPDQRAVLRQLPNPASVLRICHRERKARRLRRAA
jgi:hypothetical protein